MPVSRFSVTVLGSGTCTPMFSRRLPGYLLTMGDHLYLVDSGSGTIDRLLAVGVPPVTLNALFYTHTHLDHVADLFPLLFSMTNAWGDARRDRPITVSGPPGFQTFFDKGSELFPSATDESRFPVHVHEFDDAGAGTDLPGGFHVEAVPLEHSVPSVGYRFTAPSGHVICLTGDTDACPALETLLRHADLVIAECSTPDDLKIPGHLSPTPLGKACQAAGVKRLVLSHLYPMANASNLLPDLRRVFDGEAVLAEDGKRYAVRDTL